MAQRFICLLGIDGSGKTTQAEELVNKLRRRGEKARYVWCRWQPLLMKPIQLLGRAFLKRSKLTDRDYRRFTHAKQSLIGKGWKARLWLSASLLDYFVVQVLWKVVLGRRKGEILVCDRYLADTLVDQSINLGLSPEETPRLLNARLARLFPKPTDLVLIDINPRVAFKRKEDVFDPEYLEDRRERYLAMGRAMDANVVRGSGSIEEVSARIDQCLGLGRTEKDPEPPNP